MAKLWEVWNTMAEGMGKQALWLYGVYAAVAVALGVYLSWTLFWVLIVAGIIMIAWDLLMSLFRDPPKRG